MSNDFSPEELKELRAAFALFDKDGDGGITRKELASVLGNFGQALGARDMNYLFSDSDIDGDDRLSFDEFQAILLNLDESRPEHVALREALQIILSIQGSGRKRRR